MYCTKPCNIEIAHLKRSRSVSSSTYENELFLFQLWYQLWHRSLVYHKHRYSGCKFCVFPYGCNWKSSHHYGISKNTFSSLSSQYAPLLFSLIAHKIGEIQRNFDIYCATRIITETSGYIASGVSILTLTAISIERYFAVYFHLRYNEIVTNFRALVTVVFLWSTMTLVAGARFLMKDGKKFNTITIPILFSSLIITIWSYSRIYTQVKRHHRCIQDQEKSVRIIGIARCRKSIVTMIYILGLFILSNAPMIAVVITHKVTGYTRPVKEAYIYVSTIVFVCSSINPMIYCWRIPEIRRAVLKIIKIVFCLQAQTGSMMNNPALPVRVKEFQYWSRSKVVSLI